MLIELTQYNTVESVNNQSSHTWASKVHVHVQYIIIHVQ